MTLRRRRTTSRPKGPSRLTDELEHAVDVWDYFVAEGGLDVDGWDAQLVDSLRQRLQLGEGSVRERLVAERISTERFMGALLTELGPFAAMMSGLLGLFAAHGVERTDGSAEIVFDFDSPDLPQLAFDLEHFRRMQRTFEAVTSPIVDPAWFQEYGWQLRSILVDALHDPTAWAEQEPTDQWPDPTVGVPVSDSRELDAQLARVASVWIAYVTAARECSADRADLGRRASEADDHETSFEAKLYRTASDYWHLSVASAAADVADASRRKISAELLTEQLAEFFAQHPLPAVMGAIERLREILDLPIWKHRYDLYSAWVLVALVDACPVSLTLEMAEPGVLRFPFKATRMARSVGCGSGFTIWSELRTPLSDPVGETRQAAIQPDYSLLADPHRGANDPSACAESSLLEVECKQYKHPNNKSFAAALEDYAAGRPNAGVLLVSHGRLNRDTITAKIRDDLRDRTDAIGHLHPGDDPGAEEARIRFRAVVASHLSSFASNVTGPVECRLEWTIGPKDLDLHLFVDGPDGHQHVKYSDLGDLSAPPFARLDRDQQEPGVERLTIDHAMPGARYVLAVHAYSDDAPLAAADARITIESAGFSQGWTCPSSRTGRWWWVASYGPTHGLRSIDELRPDAPAPGAPRD